MILKCIKDNGVCLAVYIKKSMWRSLSGLRFTFLITAMTRFLPICNLAFKNQQDRTVSKCLIDYVVCHFLRLGLLVVTIVSLTIWYFRLIDFQNWYRLSCYVCMFLGSKPTELQNNQHLGSQRKPYVLYIFIYIYIYIWSLRDIKILVFVDFIFTRPIMKWFLLIRLLLFE